MNSRETILEVNNVSKIYRLGQIGATSLREELERFFNRLRKKEKQSKFAGDSRYDKEKNEFWALNDLNFNIKKGEIVGIIGRNGAGKSTLLKLISRITEPSVGQIKYKGKLASLLEVGTGFHPELSGRDNIYLNGAILGMSRKEVRSKFSEIVEFAGIGHHLDTPVKRYSSGMYVRLAFAIAAHIDPDILIVDEVLAVGDMAFQKKCIGKMQDVASEGRTVLFVSHNFGLIKNLCTQGIVLHEGKISFNGDVPNAIKNCLDNYKTKVDLSEIENSSRQGIGNHRFKSIEVLNNSDQTTILEAGKPIRMAFDVSPPPPEPKRMGVVVRIYDPNNSHVSTLNSSYSTHLHTKSKDGKYYCTIQNNVMMPGSWKFEAELWYEGKVQDSVSNPVPLDIEESYYNDRHLKNIKEGGSVFMNDAWETPT